MHDAGLAQPGTMAAVLGLDDDQVEVACRRADADVWVANFNAPGQVVIAGSPVGRRRRAPSTPRSSAPRRSCRCRCPGRSTRPFMAAARDRLRTALAAADPRDTDVPVVSNVDALAHDQGADWASLLSAQLSSPVRWKHCLLTLAERGVTDFAELGPGAVLTGMAKRTVDRRPHDLGVHPRGPRQAARVGRRRHARRPPLSTRASTSSPSSGSS